MGLLPQAMVNYLALLGWNDGTEDEIFSLDQLSKWSFIKNSLDINWLKYCFLKYTFYFTILLHELWFFPMLNLFTVEKFSIERITKSAAIFDGIKLRYEKHNSPKLYFLRYHIEDWAK